MHVVQLGNRVPPFSTENDLHHAMVEGNGWDVRFIQEGDSTALLQFITDLQAGFERPDFILWTSTRDLANQWGHELQWKLLAEARRHNIPVVAYHLDRWMGLKRQNAMPTEPYFRVDLLVTADGAHQDEWAKADVNHHWMLPGVSERWCQPGTYREELATDIVFVGSWQDYGHREWRHRGELVAWLQKTYGDRVAFYPKQGEHAVRGLELNDVYWSAKVVVGDSCLAPKVDGSPMTNYCSDRVPETLGRGGYLLHPSVEGINDFHDPFWDADCLCDWWEMGDWGQLRTRIDTELSTGDFSSSEERLRRIELIRENHTYTVRMRQLAELLIDKGMLP